MLHTLGSFLLKDKEDKTFRCQFFNRIQNMNVETISFRIKVGSPFYPQLNVKITISCCFGSFFKTLSILTCEMNE